MQLVKLTPERNYLYNEMAVSLNHSQKWLNYEKGDANQFQRVHSESQNLPFHTIYKNSNNTTTLGSTNSYL